MTFLKLVFFLFAFCFAEQNCDKVPQIDCLAVYLNQLQGDYTCSHTARYNNDTEIDNKRCWVVPALLAWPVNNKDVKLLLAACNVCSVPFSILSVCSFFYLSLCSPSFCLSIILFLFLRVATMQQDSV